MAFQKTKHVWDTHISGRTPINDSNVGHKLLEKMGWQKGVGLGRESQGMVENPMWNWRSNECRTGLQSKKETKSEVLTHQKEFDDLLCELNATSDNKITPNSVPVSVTETDVEIRKRTVRYSKIARAKDTRCYSAKDLEGIIGKDVIHKSSHSNETMTPKRFEDDNQIGKPKKQYTRIFINSSRKQNSSEKTFSLKKIGNKTKTDECDKTQKKEHANNIPHNSDNIPHNSNNIPHNSNNIPHNVVNHEEQCKPVIKDEKTKHCNTTHTNVERHEEQCKPVINDKKAKQCNTTQSNVESHEGQRKPVIKDQKPKDCYTSGEVSKSGVLSKRSVSTADDFLSNVVLNNAPTTAKIINHEKTINPMSVKKNRKKKDKCNKNLEADALSKIVCSDSKSLKSSEYVINSKSVDDIRLKTLQDDSVVNNNACEMEDKDEVNTVSESNNYFDDVEIRRRLAKDAKVLAQISDAFKGSNLISIKGYGNW